MGAMAKKKDIKNEQKKVRSIGCYTTNQSSQYSQYGNCGKNIKINNKLSENFVFLTKKDTANLLEISVRAVEKAIKSNKYQTVIGNNPGKGPKKITYIVLSSLPEDAQRRYWESLARLNLKEAEAKAELAADKIGCQVVQKVKFEMQILVQRDELTKSVAEVSAAADKIMKNDKVTKKIEAIREALDIPAGIKTKEWQSAIANKYGITYSTLRRWIEKHEKVGMVGLAHGNSFKEGLVVKWSDTGLKTLRGLFLKRENRKMSKKQIYALLAADAEKKGYEIGGYSSALGILKKLEEELNPLVVYRDQGIRGLDNKLAPVVRNYHDLRPFQILVGDQHRFDFWVVDEDTGKVFRPEGYVWQDLNTRCIYGVAIGKKYDAAMMGEALYMGIKIFGKPEQVYNDNGRPEKSKYFLDKSNEFRQLGIETNDIGKIPAEVSEKCFVEFSGVYADLEIKSRFAKVRNAKAKMIEATFKILEDMLIDYGCVGYVNQLGGNKEENETDVNEIKSLAKNGKLLTFTDFCKAFLNVCIIYNREKHHKGLVAQVRKERIALHFDINHITPFDYLKYKFENENWRPAQVDHEALDLIFLYRAKRKVNKGMILFEHNHYTHDKLNNLADGTTVEIRYDRNDIEKLIVFLGGNYFCDAFLVEYSSMTDDEKTKRLLHHKYQLKKKYIEVYKEYTKPYGNIQTRLSPSLKIETEAFSRKAVRQKEAQEKSYRERLMSEEDFQAHSDRLRELEKKNEMMRQEAKLKSLPDKPKFFVDDYKRYLWCHKYLLAGGTLEAEDISFMRKFEAEKDCTVLIDERRINGVNV